MTAVEQQPDLHLVDAEDPIPADPIALWNARAEAHQRRADIIADMRFAAQIREQRHAEYLAENRRRLERIQSDQNLELAGWVQPTPPDVRDIAGQQPEMPEPWRPSPQPRNSPSEITDELRAQAVALFADNPGAGRETVKSRLDVGEYAAKILIRDHKPGAQQ